MASTDQSLQSKRVVVMGLGNFGGGASVTRWLCDQNAVVTLTDGQSEAQLANALSKIQGLPVRLVLGSHPLSLLDDCDLLVVNPAVDKSKSDFVAAAVNRNIPITTEINLFLQRCPATVAGITGSTGKSTTTAMIHLALSAVMDRTGKGKCWLGGNIGRSLLPDLPAIRDGDIVVLELSSFMLEDTPRIRYSPHVAVVTNLVGNHLDRHGDIDAYARAKQNIIRFQTAADFAVLNGEDSRVASWCSLTPAQCRHYSAAGKATVDLRVPGLHNQSNAQAAMEVIRSLGFESEMPTAIEALRTFRGLPHRLELVRQIAPPSGRQIQWFNDSKATTPESAVTALQAFDRGRLICIVGGYDKHADMTEFTRQLAMQCDGILGIGATGPELVRQVLSTTPDLHERCMVAGTLENAMRIAHDWLRSRPNVTTILLSPGCASWGQFTNYEQRGRLFSELANAAVF